MVEEASLAEPKRPLLDLLVTLSKALQGAPEAWRHSDRSVLLFEIATFFEGSSISERCPKVARSNVSKQTALYPITNK